VGWDVSDTITQRLLTYLEKVAQPVSYTILKDKTAQAGYTTVELHRALSDIAKIKGIKTSTKDGVLYYRYELPKLPEPVTLVPVPRHHDPTITDNFFRYSPLCTDAERISYVEGHDVHTCPCDGCAGAQWMYLTEPKRRIKRFGEEREFLKSL
jgi:hypothetical protein